jgi:hypothetical protein
MKIDTSELTFHTPPIGQGQMVTYSYAVDQSADNAACIIRRRTEGGAPTEYERFEDPEWEDEFSTNLELWNQEPKLGRPVSSWTSED